MNMPPSLSKKPTPPRDERSAVRQTLNALKAKGWAVSGLEYSDGEVWDTSEKSIIAMPTEELLDEIFAVDDIFVHVTRVTRKYEKGWLYFVFGNSPEEVVCNSTTNVDDDLQELHQKWWGA